MENNNVVDVNHLIKKFHNTVAVNDVSFSVEKGDIFGLFGPNGSGKTTLFRLIAGLMHPDSGTGTCLGFNINTQAEKIKSRIGFMSQKFSLYEYLSVKNNLYLIGRLYGIKNLKQNIEYIIETMNLEYYLNHLAGELSGGWKQRLALACELLKQPQLIILDEPTAGVDPNSRQEFWSSINKLSTEGMSILLSTHYMDEALRCNKIAYLAFGKIRTQGTLNDIVKQSNIYTWEISGPEVGVLVEKLHKLPEVEQIIQYGEKIHVSGRNSFHLNKALKPFQYDFGYVWRGILPTLEDVFIYQYRMAEQERDNA